MPALGAVELSDLRPPQIQAFYTRLQRDGRVDGTGGLSPKSVLRYHQVLHAALHHAVRWPLLSRNPADAVEPPRGSRRELSMLTATQVSTLLSVADATPIGSLARLAVLTGMRRGELLGLRWSDVDLDKGIASVQQSASEEQLGVSAAQDEAKSTSDRALPCHGCPTSPASPGAARGSAFGRLGVPGSRSRLCQRGRDATRTRHHRSDVGTRSQGCRRRTRPLARSATRSRERSHWTRTATSCLACRKLQPLSSTPSSTRSRRKQSPTACDHSVTI